MRKLLAFLAILSLGVALACWGLRLAGNPGGAELASGELEAEGALSPRAAELAGPRAPGPAAGGAPDLPAETRAAEEGAAQAEQDTGDEPQRPAHITGRVTDAAGVPVAGARVLLGGPGGLASPLPLEVKLERGVGAVEMTVSADDGHFKLPLRAGLGEPRLAVSAAGLARFSEQRPLRELPTGDWGEVRLAAAVVLTGRVLDHLGTPVEGARLESVPTSVRLPWDGPATGIPAGHSATDGSFRVDLLPAGAWELRAVSERHPTGAASGTTTRPGEQVNGIEIVLVESLALSGQLIGIPPGEGQGLEVRAHPARSSAGSMAEMAAETADPSLARRTAPVSSSGEFLLEGLRSDRGWRVYARLASGGQPAGDTRRSRTVEVPAGEARVELQWLGETLIRGRVVDATSGEPLLEYEVSARAGGARIRDRNGQGQLRREHPDGRFSLGGLRPREAGQTLELSVDALGYELWKRGSIRLDGAGELDLGELRLTPAGLVRVTVTGRGSGEPLGGAWVMLRPAEDPGAQIFGELPADQAPARRQNVQGRTDREGVVELTSFSGRTCEVEVSAREYARRLVEGVQLPARGVTEIAVELGRGGTVEVNVQGSAGEPLAGREVRTRRQVASDGGSSLFSARWEREDSDSTGLARFAHLSPGVHEFRLKSSRAGAFSWVEFVDSESASDVWVQANVVAGETVSIVLREEPRGALSGVVTEEGLPLVGALVSLQRDAADAQAFFMPGFGGNEVQTDASGAFRLGQLKPGDWILEVRHATRSMVARRELAVALGEQRFDLDLIVTALEGRVTDSAGRGLPGLVVTVAAQGEDSQRALFAISASSDDTGDMQFVGGGGALATVRSAADGGYRLRGVRPGQPLLVSASGGSWISAALEPVTVSEGRTSTLPDLRLSEGGTLELHIVAADDSAVGAVFISGQRSLDASGREASGGDENECHAMAQGGGATLSGLAPGTWRLKFHGMAGNGVEIDARDEVVTAGETRAVTITVR